MPGLQAKVLQFYRFQLFNNTLVLPEAYERRITAGHAQIQPKDMSCFTFLGSTAANQVAISALYYIRQADKSCAA